VEGTGALVTVCSLTFESSVSLTASNSHYKASSAGMNTVNGELKPMKEAEVAWDGRKKDEVQTTVQDYSNSARTISNWYFTHTIGADAN